MSEAEELAKLLRADRCAFCGQPAEGNFSIHRDGFAEGPEVELCNKCGGGQRPTCVEIWEAISPLRPGNHESN